MFVDGEWLEETEIKSLMAMIEHDAKEVAGEFFDMDRSDKFRKSWNEIGVRTKRSSQDCFVEYAWKHFVVHVRAMYADHLGKPNTPEKDKEKLHKALVLQRMLSETNVAESPVQMAPNSQQFVGDRYENKQTAENYGSVAALPKMNRSERRKLAAMTKH